MPNTTTITEMDGHDITADPTRSRPRKRPSPRSRRRTTKYCAVKIKSRIKGTMVEVAVARSNGNAKNWLPCWMLTQVQAFADGVADVVNYTNSNTSATAIAPNRNFVSHADEAAYCYGTVCAHLKA